MGVTRRTSLVGAASLCFAACADLALEPDRVPASVEIVPADTLIRVGDRLRLEATVLDADGKVMPAPGPWVAADWSVDDPNAVHVSPDGQAEATRAAETHVSVSLAGLSARARMRVNPDSLVLSAPAVHLVQSVQDSEGSLPLIAGQGALLRVFVTGDKLSFSDPKVQAVFYLRDQFIHIVKLERGRVGDPLEGSGVPLGLDFSDLAASYNALVPASIVQAGVELVVEVTPHPKVPAAAGSQLRVPEAGRMALDVRSVPPLDLTIVPVVSTAHQDDVSKRWTDAVVQAPDSLRLVRSLLPVGEASVGSHTPYYSSADLTTGDGWGQLLREITFLYMSDGSPGYYYGAVRPGDGSTWTGLGQIGYPVSVGRSDVETLTHELGHNMTLRHAPCGGASDPDIDFPHEGGMVGAWGYDMIGERLVDPELYKDIMGYCHPVWISDFHFRKALDHRLEVEAARGSGSPSLAGVSGGGSVSKGSGERSLVLWGSVSGGRLVLDPAFWADIPVHLPSEPGPYRLDGYGTDGRRFSLSFAPRLVEFGGGQFVFALPEAMVGGVGLERVVLSGPEGFVALERDGAQPLALLTDRGTGRLRGVVRGWEGGLPGRAARLLRGGSGVNVTVSRGLPGGDT